MLNRYERLGEAALDGSLSQGQLSELRRLDRPKYRPLLRDLQGDLLDTVRGLDDHAATEFEQAIDTALTWLGDTDTRTVAERRADALHDIVAHFNKTHQVPGTPRHHPHITLSLDASTLHQPTATHTHNGRLVSTTCTDTHLCDYVLHTVLRDPHGTPVGFGRARYTVPRPLFRQIAARDGGCRFPGRNRPVAHCEAHHITYWRHGGTTDCGNLVLLGNRHHHLVHRQRLTLELRPDATLHVRWAPTRTTSSTPRGAPPRNAPPRRSVATTNRIDSIPA